MERIAGIRVGMAGLRHKQRHKNRVSSQTPELVVQIGHGPQALATFAGFHRARKNGVAATGGGNNPVCPSGDSAFAF